MGEYLLVAILYVDDLIIHEGNAIQLKWLISKLEKEFRMNDLKELHYFLRMEFERNKEHHTMKMNQKNTLKRPSSVLTWKNANEPKLCSM